MSGGRRRFIKIVFAGTAGAALGGLTITLLRQIPSNNCSLDFQGMIPRSFPL